MIAELFENDLIRVGLRILLAFLVFVAGRWLAKRSQRLLSKSLQKSELPESIITLVTTLSYYGIWVFAGLLALGILGVPPTTLVTAFGIVVVILAIALQTSLGNLAATVIILLFKPFKIGDVIVDKFEGFCIRMASAGTCIEGDICGRICGLDFDAVEVCDKAVVVFHLQQERAVFRGVIDLEGYPYVDGGIFVVHIRVDVDAEEW